MEERSIYNDIAQRTQGDIYLGIVGPVRTGKSTFIKQFMDTLVLPNIALAAKRERAQDELPQSASGRTIMTTEPKFIPEEAVEVSLPGNARMRVRMIDCVGYIVPSALGYIENDQPRMVLTPWFEEEIPFNMAAEIGTKKVISEHSTIGLVITTDGSISEIPREEYAEAEERVIRELQEINKPFVVLLNSINPESPSAAALAQQLSLRYGVPVLPVNCLHLTEFQIKQILSQVLLEFPIREVSVNLPSWIVSLASEHWLRQSIYQAVRAAAAGLRHVRDAQTFAADLQAGEHIASAVLRAVDLSDGAATVDVAVRQDLFYKVLAESTGLEISDEHDLLRWLSELSKTKAAYDRIKNALDEVEATGYGIVMPSLEELSLEEPELMRQGGRYGVRLRASAPSLHIMKANITTEVAPIVGSESQSEELVMYLLNEFEENPAAIWESNIFGKSLHELVNEGLHNKLYRMPADARLKFQETIEKVINEGCSGLICIIL
ncbi:MAG: stage IV sporulation protein A [Oscillospiraceae bacterium]|jgi:stage IV sporulation protein A|nr:stage IV sporulation protein A [Oscillospiraceae bacterium]